MKKIVRAALAAAIAAAGLAAMPAHPASAATRTEGGYWMVTKDGHIYGFGGATKLGEAVAATVPRVDVEATSSGNGYWILGSNGSINEFGDANWLGSGTSTTLLPGEAFVSMSATPDDGGYWLFSNHGRVLKFGNAISYGDLLNVVLNGPILGSVATPSGKGYWMVGSDGGIFSFGDAKFYGSMGGQSLNKPVMSMAPDPDGVGYWLVASDGGIFAFDAAFHGSTGSLRLNKPISGMVASPTGAGYLMVASDGGIFSFGDVPFYGSLGANPPASPVVAVAAIGKPEPLSEPTEPLPTVVTALPRAPRYIGLDEACGVYPETADVGDLSGLSLDQIRSRLAAAKLSLESAQRSWFVCADAHLAAQEGPKDPGLPACQVRLSSPSLDLTGMPLDAIQAVLAYMRGDVPTSIGPSPCVNVPPVLCPEAMKMDGTLIGLSFAGVLTADDVRERAEKAIADGMKIVNEVCLPRVFG